MNRDLEKKIIIGAAILLAAATLYNVKSINKTQKEAKRIKNQLDGLETLILATDTKIGKLHDSVLDGNSTIRKVNNTLISVLYGQRKRV